MDGSEDSRVQARIQEFAKKLQPDVLYNRLRNFRKFLISITTDRKNLKKKETVTKSDIVASSPHPAPNECTRRYSGDVSSKSLTSKGGEDFTENMISKTYDSVKMDCKVPDVVVLEEKSANEPNNVTPHCVGSVSDNTLQLTVDAESSPRNKSPVTVQEWVDSLPLNPNEASRDECDTPALNSNVVMDTEADNLTLGAEAGHLCDSKDIPPMPPSPVNVTVTCCREPSEVESHCSSVDSLLESRKPDPEEILLSLGFGGTASSSYLETGRIPKRFLNPSQLKGVDIDEFMRQQQDLIYTFESGYYGYRGLAGPSHSNPSVIVAKILEKLRDHEKETSSISSFPQDFRKRSSADKNSENGPKKFSKVAHNVLTKIRCTPGSVLSPDNRRWLDSQGNKSPEINRRLIIGQKSFTFGNDGDLIESSPNGINDDRDAEEPAASEKTEEKSVCNGETNDSSHETVNENNESSPEKSKMKFDSLHTDCSTDASTTTATIKSEPQRQTADVSSPKCDEKDESLLDVPLDVVSIVDDVTTTSKSIDAINNNDCSTDLNTSSEEIVNDSSTSTERLYAVNSLPECETNLFESSLSLKEELNDSIQQSRSIDANATKKNRNVLTRCSSFEESVRSNSRDEVNVTSKDNVGSERSSIEKTEQFSDSATESEFASYPDRTMFSKNIRKQYEELTLLQSKLRSMGEPVSIVSENQFASFTSEQRIIQQLRIIREALNLYLNQLKEDDINLELKNCLTAEARKVADLLDDCEDGSKLCVIVRQMTLLLQHQNQLSAQIRELSNVDNRPTSCHDVCENISKRVRELELLVQENAQELARMKYQLLGSNKNLVELFQNR